VLKQTRSIGRNGNLQASRSGEAGAQGWAGALYGIDSMSGQGDGPMDFEAKNYYQILKDVKKQQRQELRQKSISAFDKPLDAIYGLN